MLKIVPFSFKVFFIIIILHKKKVLQFLSDSFGVFGIENAPYKRHEDTVGVLEWKVQRIF